MNSEIWLARYDYYSQKNLRNLWEHILNYLIFNLFSRGSRAFINMKKSSRRWQISIIWVHFENFPRNGRFSKKYRLFWNFFIIFNYLIWKYLTCHHHPLAANPVPLKSGWKWQPLAIELFHPEKSWLHNEENILSIKLSTIYINYGKDKVAALLRIRT